jgi:hypothetical protein
MARDLLSPVGILDATHGAVVRIAAPWLGVLWILTLPYRFAQVYFIRELVELGRKAHEYGGHLESIAWVMFALLLPAVLGRAIYVRACLLGLQSGERVGREALRVPGAQLINSIYGALLVEVLFAMTVWMFILAPVLLTAGGLVYVAALRTDRPGVIRPLVEVGRLMLGFKALSGLLATFSVAILIALVNVYMAFRAGLWAIGAIGGDGLARWEHLLRPHRFVGVVPAEPLAALICMAGAFLIVEPFWLASLTVYLHRARLRQSGEDLRLRFRLLTGSR